MPFAELARTIEPFHPPGNTFPGEVLLELAADALETAGVSREHPLHLEGLRERLLPEDAAGSQAARYKRDYAMQVPPMIAAGVQPDLLRDTAWRADDFWFWALRALVIYVRAAAERAQVPVSAICDQLATLHRIEPDATAVVE